MFWEVLLRDSGFDPNSADFGTALPPNVKEDDSLAPFLREAIRRGFLSAEDNFNGDKAIPRIQAIGYILQTKAILLPKNNSRSFLKLVSGVSSRATYLPKAEAAFASKILEKADIDPLKPFASLTRRDFITWLYRFNDHGVKKSNIDPPSKKKERNRSRRNTSNRRVTQRDLQIEILDNNASARSSRTLRIPNGQILESVFSAIDSKYKFFEQITEDKKTDMIDAAITGMVKALGDKYSSYIEPSKSDEFKKGLEGKFEGIGAYVELIDEKFTITSPIKGSPAEKAGIEAGDIVIKVDGASIEGNSVGESVDLIRGAEGTKVVLTILRDGSERDTEVIRGKITVPSITLEWKKSVPVVGVHQFNRNTGADFAKMLQEEIMPKHPRGMVIDLRNNPGGFLTSAVDMGEFFLKKGQLIFSVEYKKGKEDYNASRNGELANMKNVAILMNKGSASASEIFAGMIQDYGIGKVFGALSVGKGTVQEVSNFKNGATLKLTIAKWVTPNGRWIHEKGIIPDVEITSATADEKKNKIDRQLDAAIRDVLN